MFSYVGWCCCLLGCFYCLYVSLLGLLFGCLVVMLLLLWWLQWFAVIICFLVSSLRLVCWI